MNIKCKGKAYHICKGIIYQLFLVFSVKKKQKIITIAIQVNIFLYFGHENIESKKPKINKIG